MVIVPVVLKQKLKPLIPAVCSMSCDRPQPQRWQQAWTPAGPCHQRLGGLLQQPQSHLLSAFTTRSRSTPGGFPQLSYISALDSH